MALTTGVPHAPAHRTAVERQRKFFTHLTVYLLVIAGLCALNLYNNPDHLWFCWVAFGWGIGIIGHAIKAFASKD